MLSFYRSKLWLMDLVVLTGLCFRGRVDPNFPHSTHSATVVGVHRNWCVSVCAVNVCFSCLYAPLSQLALSCTFLLTSILRGSLNFPNKHACALWPKERMLLYSNSILLVCAYVCFLCNKTPTHTHTHLLEEMEIVHCWRLMLEYTVLA